MYKFLCRKPQRSIQKRSIIDLILHIHASFLKHHQLSIKPLWSLIFNRFYPAFHPYPTPNYVLKCTIRKVLYEWIYILWNLIEHRLKKNMLNLRLEVLTAVVLMKVYMWEERIRWHLVTTFQVPSPTFGYTRQLDFSSEPGVANETMENEPKKVS